MKTEGKTIVRIMCVAAVFFVIFMTNLILIMTGRVKTTVTCFAVDSAGDIYVGGIGEILVYSNGCEIRKFGSPSARSYVFTIDENDVVWISSGSKNYTSDLSGNVLEIWDEKEHDNSKLPRSGVNEFTAHNGDIFQLKSFLGRPYILRNGTDIVYQMPVLSYAVKLLMIAAILCFIGVLVATIVPELKKRMIID